MFSSGRAATTATSADLSFDEDDELNAEVADDLSEQLLQNESVDEAFAALLS